MSYCGRRLASWREPDNIHEFGGRRAPDPTSWQSKNVLQRELDRAIAALAANSSERSAGRVRIGPAPVRVVVHVEHLRPELETLFLPDRKILADPQVPFPEAGIAKDIARLHAEGPRRRLCERRLVKPGGIVRERGRLERGVACQVPELVAAARPDPRIIHVLTH